MQDLARVQIPQHKASNLEAGRAYPSVQPCAPSIHQPSASVSLRHKSHALYPVPPPFATFAESKSVYSSYNRTICTFGALVRFFLVRPEPKPQIIGSGIYASSNPARELWVLSPISTTVLPREFVKCGQCLAPTIQPVYTASLGSR